MESHWQRFSDSVHRFNRYVQHPDNPDKTPRITIPISKQSKRLKIRIPISFSPQFLRDIPDLTSKHRVMATTLLSMKDMLLEKFSSSSSQLLEITAIVPFPSQNKVSNKKIVLLVLKSSVPRILFVKSNRI
jgi:hypothetical protein